MREDDPENPYTLTERQVVTLFAVILAIAAALLFAVLVGGLLIGLSERLAVGCATGVLTPGKHGRYGDVAAPSRWGY